MRENSNGRSRRFFVQTIHSPTEKVFRETLPGLIPDFEVREQQIQMGLMVERGLLHDQHVIAEAGTGTGKSYAYLVPLSFVLGDDARVVISTATIALQEQLLNKDIPFLESVLGINFHAELAKGKGNYLCLLRFQEELQSRGLFTENDLIDRIQDWIGQTETGDRADLSFEPGDLWGRVCADDTCPGRKCHLQDDCFFVRARKRLHRAKVIVCNHALFFTDLNLRDASSGAASLLPDYSYLVFDEAQHIESIARRTMSIEVSNMRLQVLLNQLRKREGCHLDAIQKAFAINGSFFDAVDRLENSNKHTLFPTEECVKLGQRLQEAVKDTVRMFAVDLIGERENAIFKCLERFNQDLREIMEADDPERVYWVEKSERKKRKLITIHATHLNVAENLDRLLFYNDDLSCAVLTSATLSIGGDFTFFREKVGCSRALEISVDSPFSYEEQCLLYLPQGLPDPRAPGFYKGVAPFIQDILNRTAGRAFVLFTSYRGMNEVWNEFQGCSPWPLLRQGDLPKNKLIDQFKTDLHSVLFATTSYWEGVDVPGGALSCVILVKLPFSVPDDPLTKAKIRSIERSGVNAFYNYSLPEAVLRLRQGFGRLIRSRNDRGIVAILDPRVRGSSYGRNFIKGLPTCREITSLDEIEPFLQSEHHIKS
jgi:ATP-dependent DNA helicase DinG